MMKLILLILFCTIFSVKSKITSLNKTLLIKVGDSATLFCDKATAEWKLDGKIVADCTKCPSTKCDVKDRFKGRVTASCNETNSVLHFKSTEIDDKGGLKCRSEDSKNYPFLIGNYDDHLRPDDKYKFALKKESYTLICDKEIDGDMGWYNQGKMLSYFDKDCEEESYYDKNKFTITCDATQNKGRLQIKSVTLKDEQIFGCKSPVNKLHLYRLTVNVAVNSVSIEQQSKTLIENKEGIFVCSVIKSKPEASFQWITVDQDGGEEIQEEFNKTKTPNNKLWDTKSYLKLKMKRAYKEIKCRARIEEMPWTQSTYKLSDIKYRPDGKPKITVPKSGICVGKETEIKCEWKGGNPEATLRLECLSEVKKGGNSISTKISVPEKINTTCTCYGIHIGGDNSTKEKLNILYPPKKVSITQTSYLEKKETFLICNAAGSNPAVYNYTWLPGNHPHKKKITITLTKADNKKEYTCKVYHKCSGDNPVSNTTRLNVEYEPVIKMNDTMTVIENESNKIRCPVEGNPTPVIRWKIGQKTIETNVLQVSFTRHNASVIECIATANSSKHGILKSSKTISINVTYPPDITDLSKVVTKLEQKAEISCTAEANPNNINYTLVQKWGRTVKRKFEINKNSFSNLMFGDLGTWTCQASNGVPNGSFYTEKQVEIKVDVSANFIGDLNATAIVGSTKRLKRCFYCNPKATEVKWYKGDEEMPSDRITYTSAVDGLFPFAGNCSILELDIKEKIRQIYSLHVRNPEGKEIFEVTLDSGDPDYTMTYIIIACVIIVLILFGTIGGALFFRNKASKNKAQSNNNVDKSTTADDAEMIDNSLYGEISGVRNYAESDVEPLYAQVNKPRKILNKANDANIEDLYAKVDKSKKQQPQDNNASDVEPLYAQVNKPRKNLNKANNANVEELYAKVDISKKTSSQDKKMNNVEPLYAQVIKPPKKNMNQVNNEDLYANYEPTAPPQIAKKKFLPKRQQPKTSEDDGLPQEDIYENLEMKEKKAAKGELLYADLEFEPGKTGNKEDFNKLKNDETMYASIDFMKPESGI